MKVALKVRFSPRNTVYKAPMRLKDRCEISIRVYVCVRMCVWVVQVFKLISTKPGFVTASDGLNIDEKNKWGVGDGISVLKW